MNYLMFIFDVLGNYACTIQQVSHFAFGAVALEVCLQTWRLDASLDPFDTRVIQPYAFQPKKKTNPKTREVEDNGEGDPGPDPVAEIGEHW